MQWNYAFDLGADKVRMAMRGLEGMYTEADREAYRHGETEPFAHGEDALEFESRNTGKLMVKRYAQSGLPLDKTAAARRMRRLVQLHEKKLPGKLTVLTAVSPFIDDNSRSLFLKALLNEGFNAAGTVTSDICALLGAGADITTAETYTIADIGTASVICSCIAGGEHIKAGSLHYGIENIKKRILEALSSAHDIRIGGAEAGRILLSLNDGTESRLSVSGQDTKSGLPVYTEIQKSDILSLVSGFWNDVAELILNTVNWLPEGCAADVIRNGIVLTGGGSMMAGAAENIKKLTGLDVRVADAPDLCVTNGLRKVMENEEKYSLQISDWLETGMHA